MLGIWACRNKYNMILKFGRGLRAILMSKGHKGLRLNKTKSLMILKALNDS